MNPTVYDDILISLYLCVWIATFIWYHWKFRSLDAGSAIIGSYVAYAVVSILTLHDELFSIQYEHLKLFPFIYLYVMLMIALSPIIHHHFHPVSTINDPNTRVLKPLCWILVLCALVQVPDILSNLSEGLFKLFTDVDAGSDAYEEQSAEAIESGHGITNIFAIIFNAFYDIVVFLAFYFLTKKHKNWLLVLGTFFALFIGLLVPVMKGQRGTVIISVLTVLVGFMLFQRFYSRRLARAFRITGVAALIAVLLPVAAITTSRFGERNAGVVGFLNWYIGQANLYFNNHALDAGGIRYGDRTINLVKRMIDPSTPQNYVERRDKYHNLEIDDYYFVTFVGDFALDYGPYLAFIIFVVFNLWVLFQIRPRDGTLELHQLLLIYFTACICMQGGMYLFAYSDTANLKILVFFMLYIYLRYHHALMERFPKLTEKEDGPSACVLEENQ